MHVAVDQTNQNLSTVEFETAMETCLLQLSFIDFAENKKKSLMKIGRKMPSAQLFFLVKLAGNLFCLSCKVWSLQGKLPKVF